VRRLDTGMVRSRLVEKMGVVRVRVVIKQMGKDEFYVDRKHPPPLGWGPRTASHSRTLERVVTPDN